MAKEKIPDSAIGICPICYAKRAIAYTRFSKCVGLIFLFIGQTRNGWACKECMKEIYWDYQIQNLIVGWWWWLSIIVNPIYLISNNLMYKKAIKLIEFTPKKI